MGADIKALKQRLKSVESTSQLTRAMGLVASSKIKRTSSAMAKAREFEKALSESISMLSSFSECERSPFMKMPPDNCRIKLVVIAGDRGLAGGYNANVFRFIRDFTGLTGIEGDFCEIIPVGKRACDRFGRGFISAEHFENADAEKLAERLCREFTDGEYDRLGIVYTRYVSIMLQKTEIKWVLPLERKSAFSSTAVFEPSAEEIFDSAVRLYVSGEIASLVKESFASEIAARRVAMDSAGKNAKKMTETLTIKYNRARQGAITQEITEIVAGAGN